jgi:hypothetical protein
MAYRESRNIEPSTPARVTIFDQLIHRDMWRGIEPQLRVYRDLLGPRGQSPRDAWFREVSHIDSLRQLSSARFVMPPREGPGHAALARYAVEHSKINLEDYDLYRLTMSYPVIGQSAWVFWDGASAKATSLQGSLTSD